MQYLDINNNVVNKETSNKKSSNKETSNKETGNKESSNKETGNKKSSNKETGNEKFNDEKSSDNFNKGVEGGTILYIVALGIDERWDILDPRVIDVIKGCDLLVAEERRPALRLLAATNSRDTEVVYINEHSTDTDRGAVVSKIMSAKRVALVSDAGTPCIADPDYRVVDQCIKSGAIVRSVGSTSSIMGALSVSGFKADNFIYLGFPPRGGAERKRFFADINTLKSTAVFLERPYSLNQTLSDLSVVKKEISLSINIGAGAVSIGDTEAGNIEARDVGKAPDNSTIGSNTGNNSTGNDNTGNDNTVNNSTGTIKADIGKGELHIRGSASEIANKVGSIKAAFVVVINYK